MTHLLLSLTLALGGAQSAPSHAQEAPIFRMETGEFWVNLHHFLYVLGRAEAGEADAARQAVAAAPEDARRGLEQVSAAEREAWAAAVSAYAADLSRKDAVFDEALPALVAKLAAADDAPSLDDAGVDRAIATVLERAAPIYRKAWWPAHRAANAAWAASMQPLIDAHGRQVLAYITRAYGLPWPEEGYPVHVAAYTNWAGAYSTSGNLLMLGSLSKGNAGLYGLEITFHEAMHQWDEEIWELLLAHAHQQQVRISRSVTHPMIFFTAGEAVRHAVPSHVPYAEAFGIWGGRMGRFKPALDEVWKPWLDGRGTRDAALAAVAARAVIPR